MNLTAPFGVVESVNFPNPHPHLLNCSYRIVGMPGSQVGLQFDHFNLEHQDTCDYDAISVSQSVSLTRVFVTSVSTYDLLVILFIDL